MKYIARLNEAGVAPRVGAWMNHVSDPSMLFV